VLPSTANLDEAEATTLKSSIIAKELQNEREKQDQDLDSIAQDLGDWQTRVQEKGAFPRNEIAGDLVQTALTVAIDLLIEDPKHLTDAHRGNLARLGVVTSDNGRFSAVNSSLESLMTTLGLDADAEDSAVQEYITNLRSYEATVVSAREKLIISQDDGNVLVAIDKLKRDLSTAESTAKTVASTEQSKEALQQVLDKIRGHLDITSANVDVADMVDKVRGQLDTAKSDQAILKNVREALGTTNGTGRNVLDDIRDLKKLGDEHKAIVRHAKAQFGVTIADDAVVESIAECMRRATLAEPTLSRARALFSLDPTKGDILEAIGLLKDRVSDAEDDRDLVRKFFAFSNNSTYTTDVNNIRDRLDAAEPILKTLRTLLVPGKELVEGTGDLSRYKGLGLQMVGNGEPLETPIWFLAMASVPTTREHFTQLTERLRALMVFDSEVVDRLEVLEDMIHQVGHCVRQNLEALFDMLYACWKSNGHVQLIGGVIAVVSDGTPQTSLQALFEARLLELLIRGTSVLRFGWTDSRNAVLNAWRKVNRSVIRSSMLLQAYSDWFGNLGQPTPMNLLKELFDIVWTSNLSLSCRERSGGRVLVADVLTDGSHCFLWQPGQACGSLYAVSELQYHTMSAATVFPGRRQSGSGRAIVAEPAFIEPMTKEFVAENMVSLYDRGSYQ
jgi:hypothetical protein